MLFSDWRGYLISGFSLIWLANFYMSYYARVRVRLKSDRVEVEIKKEALDK